MIRKFINRLLRRKQPVPPSDGNGDGTAQLASTTHGGVIAKLPMLIKASGKGSAKGATKGGIKGGTKGKQTLPHVYQGTEQGIDRAGLSSAAVRTCETLRQASYLAYIVGGGVRDSLLARKPKDFDIATNATPEQVMRLFRRARIIGRRFQIVHVMYGRETIEVSTFRALQANAETDEHGRVLRDNVWGSIEEDAARRDFTINALYYDPTTDTLLDYHGGVDDLRGRILRMIGDPSTRYREDPIRMLRSARFAAKLGFTIEERTRLPIRELAPLIHNVPAARLFDEILKLLQSGHALQSIQQLQAEGLAHGVLPLLDMIVEQPDGERFVSLALSRTDERVAQGKTIAPGFLFGTLLWPQVRLRWQQRREQGEHIIPALMSAIDSVVDEQCERMAIQKRIVADMREIWSLQPRFERRQGRSPFRLLEHLRFRAGYDFLLLRCDAGELADELGQWWTDFIDAPEPEREQMISDVAQRDGARPAAKKRRRKRSKSAGSQADSTSGAEPAVDAESVGDISYDRGEPDDRAGNR